MTPALRRFLIYSAAVIAAALGYYLYILTQHPPAPERETLLSEIGEGVGELALWVFVAVYLRTIIKLALGKGPMSRRLLPNHRPPPGASLFDGALAWLDRTHIYFGLAAVALTLLHIALMGLHADIWFFPVVLALVIWQTVFGMFLSWRRSPRDLKRWSYAVHAQLVTGVAIGIFAYLGHLLVGD